MPVTLWFIITKKISHHVFIQNPVFILNFSLFHFLVFKHVFCQSLTFHRDIRAPMFLKLHKSLLWFLWFTKKHTNNTLQVNKAHGLCCNSYTTFDVKLHVWARPRHLCTYIITGFRKLPTKSQTMATLVAMDLRTQSLPMALYTCNKVAKYITFHFLISIFRFSLVKCNA